MHYLPIDQDNANRSFITQRQWEQLYKAVELLDIYDITFLFHRMPIAKIIASYQIRIMKSNVFILLLYKLE